VKEKEKRDSAAESNAPNTGEVSALPHGRRQKSICENKARYPIVPVYGL